MFTFFRYALLPIVIFCIVVAAASVDAIATNAYRKRTWPRTVATVTEARDAGQELAKISGKQNVFPDPYGKITYSVTGKAYSWQGRGRDIGFTEMTPGAKLNVFYNPQNPKDVSALVLLGLSTGLIIDSVSVAFIVFYMWYFWLRRFKRG